MNVYLLTKFFPLNIFSVIACLYLLISASVQAEKIQYANREGFLGAKISELSYPQDVIRELDNGLENYLNIHWLVSNNDQALVSIVQQARVRYDLWQEVFILHIDDPWTTGSAEPKVLVFDSMPGLLQRLSYFEINDLLRIGSSLENAVDDGGIAVTGDYFPAGYSLAVRVVVNPQSKEKIKKIKAWIARNAKRGRASSQVSARASRVGVVPDNIQVRSSGPRLNRLFDSLLDEYASQGNVPALWSSPLYRENIPRGINTKK